MTLKIKTKILWGCVNPSPLACRAPSATGARRPARSVADDGQDRAGA
jgi:hypothetical protein